MRHFASSPLALLASVRSNAGLIWALAVRDVLGRYRGSALGIAWSFFHPLIMLAIYTFVFSGVFKSRWGGGVDEPATEFAVTLFAGLLTFNFFSEIATRAPGLIVSNANFVKKVVFPLETLSIVSLCSASFHLAVSLVVLLVAEAVLQGHVPMTALCFPMVVIPLMLLSLGCSWFLSALAVYVRDVAQLAGIVTSILLFVSAVFFPLSAVPEPFRAVLEANPLAMIVDASRQLLVLGTMPSVGRVLAIWGVALVSLILGFFWFQRTRRGFSDVL